MARVPDSESRPTHPGPLGKKVFLLAGRAHNENIPQTNSIFPLQRRKFEMFFPPPFTQNFIFGLAIFNLRKFGENEAITSIPPDPRAVSSKMHMIGVRFMFGIRYQCGPLFGQKGAHP